MGSFFWGDFGLFFGHFRVISGSLWDDFGIVFGVVRGCFGIVLGSFWGRPGVFSPPILEVLGAFWGQKNGSFLGKFWVKKVCVATPKPYFEEDT